MSLISLGSMFSVVISQKLLKVWAAFFRCNMFGHNKNLYTYFAMRYVFATLACIDTEQINRVYATCKPFFCCWRLANFSQRVKSIVESLH